MWSDPIADMLTRIRNSIRVRKSQVRIPSSKIKRGIAEVLQQEGYITGFDIIDDARQGILRIDLKYGPRGAAVNVADLARHLVRVRFHRDRGGRDSLL